MVKSSGEGCKVLPPDANFTCLARRTGSQIPKSWQNSSGIGVDIGADVQYLDFKTSEHVKHLSSHKAKYMSALRSWMHTSPTF